MNDDAQRPRLDIRFDEDRDEAEVIGDRAGLRFFADRIADTIRLGEAAPGACTVAIDLVASVGNRPETPTVRIVLDERLERRPPPPGALLRALVGGVALMVSLLLLIACGVGLGAMWGWVKPLLRDWLR